MENVDSQVVAAGAVTAASTGLVGWFTQRRKGKKDVNTFALQLIEAQNTRIDNLIREQGELTGRVGILTEQNARLVTENNQLRSELAAERLKAEAKIAAAVVVADATLAHGRPVRKEDQPGRRATDVPG